MSQNFRVLLAFALSKPLPEKSENNSEKEPEIKKYRGSSFEIKENKLIVKKNENKHLKIIN